MKRFLCMAIFMSACAGRSTPTAPTTSAPAFQSFPAPQTPGGTRTIAGTVMDGSRSLAGANVSAWVETTGFGYSYMWAHGPTLTDLNGRFQLGSLPDGATVRVQLWKDGYVQQCAAPVIKVTGDTTVDLSLVPKPNVSASSASLPASAPGYRLLSGTVFEIANGDKRPVAGAFVDYEPVMDFPAALTYTDSAGRFALCGVLAGEPAEVGASLGINRVRWATVPAGVDTAIEIVLP